MSTNLGLVAALGGLLLAAAGAGGAGGGGSASREDFRRALVARALRDVQAPLLETGGKNRGPEIDAALGDLGQAPGQNWCAAMLWRWMRDAAAETNTKLPMRGSAGAKALLAQCRAAGRTVKARDMSPATCPPGTIVGWDRSRPAFSSWEGHIGVIESWNGPRFFSCLEANSGVLGDRAARMVRDASDPLLLGAAVL